MDRVNPDGPRSDAYHLPPTRRAARLREPLADPGRALHQPDDRHHRQHGAQRRPSPRWPATSAPPPPTSSGWSTPTRWCSPGCCSPPAPSATASAARARCRPASASSSSARVLASLRQLVHRGDRRPGRHGPRRRVRHALDAVDPHQRLPRHGAPQGHRRVGRHRRWRRRHRPDRLRASCSSTSGGARCSWSTCRSSSSPSSPAGPASRPRATPSSRRSTSPAPCSRSSASAPSSTGSSRPPPRLDQPQTARHVRPSPPSRSACSPGGSCTPAPDARPALLQGPALQRRLGRHDADLLRHVRHVLPDRPVLPAGARLLARSSPACSSCRWRS